MSDRQRLPRAAHGLRHRLRYRFDNVLAQGMWASLVWLGAVTLTILVVSSLLLTFSGVTLAGSEDQTWLEDIWQSMLRVLDPGTMASDVGWGRRLLALTITLFGVLVASTVIGIIASGVEARIERMRRGRSAVVEADHLVVLGRLERRLALVIGQLVLANAGRGGTTIVVLADRDPSELNEEVRALVRDLRGSRLVFRAGDPTRTGGSRARGPRSCPGGDRVVRRRR
jgi:ion channel POLLUX/CASTOR